MNEAKLRLRLLQESTTKLQQRVQKVFNKFIRERDADFSYTYFTCISCGKTKPTRQMDAGHYYNVNQYKGLRFNEDNVHGECKYCNKYNRDGHLIGYRENLIKKIGNERFEKLEINAGYYKRNKYNWDRNSLTELYFKYK